MATCIKCGKEDSHSLCESCADELLNSYSPDDQLAYALLGVDVLRDKRDGMKRPPHYLQDRLEYYKRQNNANK